MKRFIFICSFVAFTANVIAQSINEIVPSKLLFSKTKMPIRDKGLQFTLEGGYNNSIVGLGDEDGNSPKRKNFSAYNGSIAVTYKFNSLLSFGIGGGVNLFKTSDTKYHIEGERHNHLKPNGPYEAINFNEGNDGFDWNVFARGVIRLFDTNLSPIFSVDLGVRNYNFDGFGYRAYEAIVDETFESLSSAIFVAPSLGLSLRASNNSYIELKIGYDYTSPLKKQYSEETYPYGNGFHKVTFDETNMSSFYVRLGFTHTLNLMPKTKYPKYQYNYSYFETGNSQVDEDKVKEIFEQAYNASNNETQQKYNLYMDVIKADPYNRTGYLALAYNNIGVIYENSGNEDKAIDYYRIATIISPDYQLAINNLNRVKSNRNSRRWDSAINNLSAVGQSLKSLGNSMQDNYGTGQSYQNFGNNEYFSSTNEEKSSKTSSKDSKTQPKKNNSQLLMSYDRSYGNYESQLAKMKSSGNYQVSEVKDIQRKMKEIREKYNKASGRTRSISPYETWNP